MSRRIVGYRDGKPLWELEDPRPAHAHVHMRGIRGVYGTLQYGEPGPADTQRRSQREHMARQRAAREGGTG